MYHIMLLAIRTTQVKKTQSKKEILKKEKKKVTKTLLQRYSNPDTQSHWTTSVNAYKVSLKGICTPSLW